MNQYEGLPVGDAIDFGWNTFKDNAAFILGIQIAMLFVTTLIEVIAEIAKGHSDLHAAIMWLVSVFVTTVFEVGVINIALKYRDAIAPEFADLFDRLNLVLFYLLSSIVVVVSVCIGIIFLLVPGIVVALRFQFFGYSIVDKGSNPVDAIQDSFEITRGYGFDLFLFALLLFAINMLGFICLFVGLFVSLPVTTLATAYIYRHLRERYVAPAANPVA